MAPFVLQGEPLGVIFRIENKTSEELLVRNITYFDDVKLYNKHEDDEKFEWFERPLKDTDYKDSHISIPGSGYVESSLLFHNDVGRNSGEFAVFLDKPGRYVFYAEYNPFPEARIQSNRIEAIIKATDDVEAFEQWVAGESEYGNEMIWYIQGQGGEKGRTQLLEFIERFPDTVYADVARSVLGIEEESRTASPIAEGNDSSDQLAKSDPKADPKSESAESSSPETAGENRIWIILGIAILAALAIYFGMRRIL